MSGIDLQKKLLTELSDKLKENQVAELKFLVGDVIPKTELSQIDNGVTLFETLEQRGHPGLALLRTLFHTIGRENLVRKMAETYPDQNDPIWQTDQPVEHPTPYRTLLYELGKELNEENVEVIKFMYKEDVGERTMQNVTSAFELFEVLEDHGKIGPPDNVAELEETMKMSGREDLLTKIKEYVSKNDGTADTTRKAMRRKDTPWASHSPFASGERPQALEEEEEDEDEEEKGDISNGGSDEMMPHRSTRLSTIPEERSGSKRAAMPENLGCVEEEEDIQRQDGGPGHTEGENTRMHDSKEGLKGTSEYNDRQRDVKDDSSSGKTSSKDRTSPKSEKTKTSRFCVVL